MLHPRTGGGADQEEDAERHERQDAVGSFATLMAELATLTRDRVVPAGVDERAAFDLSSELTSPQARAFELIGVSPASV